MDIEEVGRSLVDAATKVHRALGPGLLESAHQKCLAYELDKRGLRAKCEVVLPIVYDDQRIDAG
jgi:GxxExxY protein